MTHEEGDTTHGWLIAYDVGTLQRTAAWCTTPNGDGAGIWQAGQGPAADDNGDIYVMTGNYGVQDRTGDTVPPAAGDLPDSIVKLHYTPPGGGLALGKLEAVAWFTPFQDHARNRNGDDNFQDYDLGSAGPVPLPGLNLVVGAGKDGVLYVLDSDSVKFGKGSDFTKLKQPPIFFTYFPGFGIDASQVANLDHLFDGKTHHLHASPAFWVSPNRGPMLFDWGENECLRAWTIDGSGKVTFVAKSAEVASAGLGGMGGMPGGFVVVTSNQSTSNSGIVWATAPLSHDANRHIVEGIVRAYDASALNPVMNSDGTPRLKLLWDSKHIPNNSFNFSKFCPPVVVDGKLLVATYDGRVDVYSLAAANAGPLPTNAVRMPHGNS
jgi:outer membrane protein assembly factor BamB